MATFSQFFVSWSKKSEVKQFYWLCGPEKVLIEDVIKTIKEHLQLPRWNIATVSVGTLKERAVWSEIEQYPLDGEPRLVVVRNAEKLDDTDRIVRFVKNRAAHPHTHVIFVSNDDALPRVPIDDKKTKLADHVAVFSAQRGTAVECKPFTATTAKHAVAWVKSKAHMRDGVASHLLNRSDGDLKLVRDLFTKIQVYPVEASVSLVNDLLSEQPRENLVDALLSLDKRTAFQALERLPSSEYSRTLGLLDARLDFAGFVHDKLMERKDEKEIAREAGNKGFLVPAVAKVAKHYDKTRRINTRRVLRIVDESLQDGMTIGVMENIINEW